MYRNKALSSTINALCLTSFLINVFILFRLQFLLISAIRKFMKIDTYTTPFPHSYWAIPAKLLAGEYPGAQNEADALVKLDRLIGCGIRQIINLMEPDEKDHTGKQFNDYKLVIANIAINKSVTVRCLRFPIPDLNIPTAKQVITRCGMYDRWCYWRCTRSAN